MSKLFSWSFPFSSKSVQIRVIGVKIINPAKWETTNVKALKTHFREEI